MKTETPSGERKSLVTRAKFEVRKRISNFQTNGDHNQMPAIKISTEQAPRPHHNCPQDVPIELWYDMRYVVMSNPYVREAYWSRVPRPEGCWYNCPDCWRMDEQIEQQISLARAGIAQHEKRISRSQKHPNGKHRGKWTLCLNYSPQWYENDYEAQEAIRLAINRLLRYYKNDIKEFRAIGEYTKAGRSHVHVYYELENGGKFTDKNLNRAYPHWNPKVKVGDGVKGGQHAPVKDEVDYRGYIEKDLEVTWLDVTYPNAISSEIQEVQVPTPPSCPPSPPPSTSSP